MPHAPLTDVLARIDATRADAHARLFEFLRIPSVSAQPAHAADCRRAAEWAASHLRASGFTATIVSGWLLGLGNGNSVTVPFGEMRPIALPTFSVNQRLPSGPLVIPSG